MTERTLSTRDLNRALLARQLLLERSRLPLSGALEQVAGLQTQYAPSAYVALWSRLRDFQRDELTRALEQRRAVQATLMRSTIHVVSAGDYPMLAAGVRQSRRAWWLRVQRRQLEGVDMEAVAALLRKYLASDRAARPSSSRCWRRKGSRGPRGPAPECGSTWSACRPREPGNSGAPTCTAWPTTGSMPRAA